MSKSKRALILICLAMASAAYGAEAVSAKAHPDSANWEDLFAKDFSNAIVPEGVWSWAEGVLTATEDKAIWTKDQYENCILDLEFKNAPGTNSGVFVYASDRKNWIHSSVEIQIADDYDPKWSGSPKSWQCAAIFGHQPVAKRTVKKAGAWNRMTITCQGQKISVVLNGELVNEFDMGRYTSAKKNLDGSDIPPWLSRPKAELPTKGHIGLQGKHAGAPIYFRNLKIKELD